MLSPLWPSEWPLGAAAAAPIRPAEATPIADSGRSPTSCQDVLVRDIRHDSGLVIAFG